MVIRFIDLCSGIGGFHSGLMATGNFQCVGHAEIDKHAAKAYRAIYGSEGGKNYGDLRKINPKGLPDFDLLCAGFPCQSFSVAGRRLGFDDTRGTVFFEIARIIAEKRPPFLLLENVPGLLSHDSGRTLTTIFSTLVEMGYETIYTAVADFFTLMGNMGADIFNLSWVQATVELFTLFGWALFVAGVVVAIFDVAIEYQNGRADIKSCAINILKGFFACSLL